MEGWNMILLIVGIVAAVALGTAFLIPYLIKKGVNVGGAISGTGAVLDTTGKVVDGLIGMFPGQAALTIVTHIAVGSAERMKT